jgi:hypothetical protein
MGAASSQPQQQQQKQKQELNLQAADPAGPLAAGSAGPGTPTGAAATAGGGADAGAQPPSSSGAAGEAVVGVFGLFKSWGDGVLVSAALTALSRCRL